MVQKERSDGLLGRLYRLYQYLRLKTINNEDQEENDAKNQKIEDIPASIKVIQEKLNETFIDSSDFGLRQISLEQDVPIKIVVAFIDGLVDKNVINMSILKPLMIEWPKIKSNKDYSKTVLLDILKEKLLNSYDIEEVQDFRKTIDRILSGDTVIYIEEMKVAISVETKGWVSRSVEQPDTESVVRGPREGFVETLQTNLSLIRRKIKNPKLKFESLKLGEQTNTDICIGYIKGIANEVVIETVRRRLRKIKIDAILESGYIEAFIEDAPFSLFPTVGNSEKPDVIAAKLLEGRVAIFCDGTPFVLTVPYLFIESLQVSEDYYSNAYFASLLRIFRFIALFISTMAPAFYVALIAFHQGVIPFKLLLTITASREGIPFSPFIEALGMGIVFELIKEAGIRMPRQIGQAVSIVGALVLGQAAVEAGLVSTLMVIVTAITAISSFVIPSLGDMMPILRIAMLVVANILGFMGIELLMIGVLAHLCTLRSFGVPYMAPFAPLNGMDLKDTFIRVPLWAMVTRPRVLLWKNKHTAKYRMKINFRKKED